MKLLPPKEENKEGKEGPGASPEGESALFGLTEAALQELIRSATESGCVTYDQIDALLRSDDAKSEQIEDILAKLTEMGVRVLENGSDTDIEVKGDRTTSTEPNGESETANELAVIQQLSTMQTAKAPAERIDDPLRIYLRDMGSIALLSREGEVAIAKRIEAGRETMMAGLCESSLTFQAISIWRDELYGGKVLLRDIIDLDATITDRDIKPTPVAVSDIERRPTSDYLPGQPDRPPQMPASPPQCGTIGDPIGDRTPKGHEVVSESDIDEDDMQKWLSISAMEAELKPKVFETFSSLADNFKRLRRLQELNIQGKLKNERLSPAQERKSKEFKKAIIAEVKSLRLNQAR